MPTSASEPMVWRGFTREALEAQYRLNLHPDRGPSYARQAQASAAARAELRWTPITYGPHPRERIELFHGTAGAPLFVFIHGGYWRGLEMETFSFVARPFVECGVWVANVEYPLAPEVSVTAITRSAITAVSRAMAEAAGRGANSARTVVSGHSAGGHLTAAMLAADRHVPGASPLALAGALPISGLFDLEPLSRIGLNDTLKMDAEEAVRLSPMRVVSRDFPPVIAAVGGDETDEFRRQSIDYAAAIRTAGGKARSLIVPRGNHFTVLDALGDAKGVLFEAACELLA